MSAENPEDFPPVSRKSTGHTSDESDNSVPQTYVNGPAVQNFTQSIYSNGFVNQHGVNFVSQGGSGIHQSIIAETVGINGGVKYVTTNYFVDQDTVIRQRLQALVTLEFEERQRRYAQEARKRGAVGGWVLQSPEFTRWRDGDTKRLWCYGIPGAGKTILASSIINHLETEFAPTHKDTACVYIYFDFDEQDQQGLFDLLVSLLGQLLRKGDNISHECRNFYRKYDRTREKPTSDELVEILKAQINYFSRVFLVIDALDECSNDPETNCLDNFLEALESLSDKAHILFTSRNDRDIGIKVHADEQFEFIAQEEAIRAYVRNRIKSRKELAFVVNEGAQKDVSLMKDIMDAVVARSKGMFLLSRLYMDFITSKSNREDLESSVQNLRIIPYAFYDATIKRICRQRDFKCNLAIDILMWLVYARKPLTILELSHAVSVQRNDKTLVKGRILPEAMFTSVCFGLVQVNEATNQVYLAHDTAKEYLRNKEPPIFTNVQSKIAETCLTYLMFKTFDHVPGTESDLRELRTKYPFLSYAANHWGYHVALVPGKGYSLGLANALLNEEIKVMNAFRFMTEPRLRMDVNISALHITAYFGADNLTKELLKEGFGLNEVTERGETALHWAVHYHQKGVIRVLLKHGIDLNVQDIVGVTALHKAVRSEDADLVALLLSYDRKLNLELTDREGWTVLRWAAKHCSPDIVRQLLRSGADPVSQDREGWTAIRWATKREDERMVELLIEESASIHKPAPDQWTVLVWAARNGLSSIISLLVNIGVELNEPDSDGYTALRWAIDYGHGMTAWLLIQAGADINKPDTKDFTPLHSAVKHWDKNRDKSLVWLLLESKANIDVRTKHGLTSLHIAAMCGHSSVVWLLLEKGADPCCVDNAGHTSLHCAIVEGHLDIARMLVQRARALLDIVDKEENTVLHTAATIGNLDMVLFLLSHNINPDARNDEGYTPLDRANSQNHGEVASALSRKGASATIRNKGRSNG